MENEIDFKKYKYNEIFSINNNIYFKLDEELYDHALGIYVEHLDDNYKLFAKDLVKEIIYIYFNEKMHENKKRWLMLKKKRDNTIKENKYFPDQYKVTKLIDYDNEDNIEKVQSHEKKVEDSEGLDNTKHTEKEHYNTSLNKNENSSNNLVQNKDKIKEKIICLLLNKYFLGFCKNVEKINKEYLESVNTHRKIPFTSNLFINKFKNKMNNLTINMVNLTDEHYRNKKIKFIINHNIENSSNKNYKKKHHDSKLRNTMKNSIKKKSKMHKLLNEVSLLDLENKLQDDDDSDDNDDGDYSDNNDDGDDSDDNDDGDDSDDNDDGDDSDDNDGGNDSDDNDDGDAGDNNDNDEKNKVKKKNKNSATLKSENKSIKVSASEDGKNLNNGILDSSDGTNSIVLNQLNILKGITDEVKKEKTVKDIDQIKKEDIPRINQEERKLDEFYEYENKIFKNIHKQKKNIYAMINKDLDILLKPAQKEYLKVARNIKNKLLNEYEQILQEEMSEE